MGLLRNIFIVLIIGILLFLIINHFFLKSNIIWDNITRGLTDTTNSTPVPWMNTGLIVPNSAFPTLNSPNIMFSIWFFIDDYTDNIKNQKYISTLSPGSTSDFTLQTYLTQNTNNLAIEILTSNSTSNTSIKSTFTIQNIPLQKWNCLIISIVNKTMDIYLEGKLINSYILPGYYISDPNTNLYIGNNKENFFNGFITRARYANGGVNPQEAYNIYREGIATSFAGNFLNQYRLKIGLYQYNKKINSFTI